MSAGRIPKQKGDVSIGTYIKAKEIQTARKVAIIDKALNKKTKTAKQRKVEAGREMSQRRYQ